MSGPLTGRVAVVTGASRQRAIGAAVARRLAADGASVFVHSWSPYDAERPWGGDPGGAEALVEELRAGGTGAVHSAADLADPAAPARPSCPAISSTRRVVDTECDRLGLDRRAPPWHAR
jgi:3-oxoacyl-[acyl-carrier protein] reductase